MGLHRHEKIQNFLLERIIFKPTEKASFYFSYSESFLPRSGEQFNSLSPISAALDPDIFESSEIGIKMDVSDNLNFTLAANMGFFEINLSIGADKIPP